MFIKYTNIFHSNALQNLPKVSVKQFLLPRNVTLTMLTMGTTYVAMLTFKIPTVKMLTE
jgi:hypothetical protein